MRVSRLATAILLVGTVGLLGACGTGPSDPLPGEGEDVMMPAATVTIDSTLTAPRE